MATLTGNKIKDTYYKLVQVDNGQLVQNGIGSPLTGSINLSGSLHVTGSQTVGGDLTVTGDVKARAFITELTQSTVLYKSGSTAFGDDASDTHSFSGSVTMHNSLSLGNYTNVSQSLDTAEDTIIANSSSAHTQRNAISSSTATSLRAEYLAGDSALSGAAHTQREAIKGLATAANNSLSSSTATALRTEYTAGDTALSGAQNTYINAKSAQHPLKIGTNLFSGSNTFTGSLIASGGFTNTGNIVSINEDSRLVQLDRRVQFRIIPTASGNFRGHLATTFSPSKDETVVSMYGGRVEIGTVVESGLYTDDILMGNTSSITQMSGSINMSGTLTLGNFSDVSASLDSANDTIVANSSSAHTQRTAISGALATTISGLDASGFATDAELTAVSGALDTTIDSIVAANVSHSAGIVDLPGKKIQYTNMYAAEADLPSAATYHGMFAHVHATGLGYFAHGGNWIKLANSGSEASAVRAEYVAADTTLSSSAHTQRVALIPDLTSYAETTAVTSLSSSAHTQRTALSASSAAVIQTSASIASGYISIEKLKTFITGSYTEFQAAIGSL